MSLDTYNSWGNFRSFVNPEAESERFSPIWATLVSSCLRQFDIPASPERRGVARKTWPRKRVNLSGPQHEGYPRYLQILLTLPASDKHNPVLTRVPGFRQHVFCLAQGSLLSRLTPEQSEVKQT